jgi:sulfide dehydrogenase cytochrome subunit
LRVFLIVAAMAALAGEPQHAVAAGPPGAEACTGCHVKGGGVGVLQGRPAEDTIRSMEAFRTGARPATLMNRIVKGFTQDEVAALSVWFSKQ